MLRFIEISTQFACRFPFYKKLELSKKTSSVILNELPTLAISETRKTGFFTLPEIGKLASFKRKAPIWGAIPLQGKRSRFLPRQLLRCGSQEALKNDCSGEEVGNLK
jgi:hypothetical protein